VKDDLLQTGDTFSVAADRHAFAGPVLVVGHAERASAAPDYPGDVWTGAYASTVGLTVETDDDQTTGCSKPVVGVGLAAEPLVPQAGYPFNRVGRGSGRSSSRCLVSTRS